MRLLKNRKGMELAIGFIVTLILAIAVLGGSLVLMNKFFTAAHKEKASIDAQTESQILSMLAGGSKVAIPINTIETKVGKLATFGVGILNVLRDTGDSNDFTITADDCGLPSGAMLTQPSQQVTVKKNERKIFLVAYQIPDEAESKTYICNINVDVNGEPYAESVYKAYIKVTS
jgi:hypothetical protein